MKIVLASHNSKKIKELQNLLGANFQLHSLSEWSKDEIIEDGLSFVENAIIKARSACKITKLPAIADDSGLCVKALQGAPGIYSARYSGLGDAENNQKLLRDLENVQDRSAFFISVLVFLEHENDPTPLIATGIWHGQILPELKGENGFGYDPLFYLPELGKTAAELSSEEKNKLSHRGLAMQKLLKLISQKYNF